MRGESRQRVLLGQGYQIEAVTKCPRMSRKCLRSKVLDIFLYTFRHFVVVLFSNEVPVTAQVCRLPSIAFLEPHSDRKVSACLKVSAATKRAGKPTGWGCGIPMPELLLSATRIPSPPWATGMTRQPCQVNKNCRKPRVRGIPVARGNICPWEYHNPGGLFWEPVDHLQGRLGPSGPETRKSLKESLPARRPGTPQESGKKL